MEYFVILLFLFFLIIELLVIFIIQKDIIDPAFVLCAVFCIAVLNLLTNVWTIGITIHLDTLLIVCGGIFFFEVGNFLGTLNRFRMSIKKFSFFSKKRVLDLSEKKMIGLLVFNCFSILYILRDVYILAKVYGNYQGSFFGALGRFAEVSKFSGTDLKVGTISTLLTALVEAEGYVLGYVIVDRMVQKRKTNILTYLCLLTAFLSTFCQGSRGGIFMVPTFIIIYIMLYRKKNRKKSLQLKFVVYIFGVVFITLVVFQVSASVVGKSWDVPIYEYLSVYLGFPTYNLDVAISNGIPRAEIAGQMSFKGLLKNLFARVGKELPDYNGYGKFVYLNGHNMGNVYTIFAPLLADYGVLGALLAMAVLGFGMHILYKEAFRNERVISWMKIVYGYYLTCTGFSFFSNKICENINIYHFYVFFFMYCWSVFLQKGENTAMKEA